MFPQMKYFALCVNLHVGVHEVANGAGWVEVRWGWTAVRVSLKGKPVLVGPHRLCAFREDIVLTMQTNKHLTVTSQL